MNEGRLQMDEARSSLSPHPSPRLLQAAKHQKKTTRESMDPAQQPNSIQILTKDELVHVFSFIGIFDYPVALRETCRHFSNEIDWGLIIRNCVLCRWWVGSNSKSKAKRSLQNLYMQQTIRQRFICQVLVNPTLNGTLMRELLLMAVNENDTETVHLLLAEETCKVDGVLDKALIRDKTEVAAILQNDPRVKSLIVMCSKCNENPGCMTCRSLSLAIIGCADPDGASKKYCKICQPIRHGQLCIVCEKYSCEHCQNSLGIVYEQHARCTTCSSMACESELDFRHEYEPCFRKCKNWNWCENTQCNNCRKGPSGWYQCAGDLDHLFCQDCEPDVMKYYDNADLEHGQSLCSVCHNNDRRCWNSDVCGEKERDSLSGSSVWYVCPENSDHMFCPNCDPTTPGNMRDIMIEDEDRCFDLEKCPACQGFTVDD
jgi:hypothetical protein